MFGRLLLTALLGLCALPIAAQRPDGSTSGSTKIAAVAPARGAAQKVLVPGTRYVVTVGVSATAGPGSTSALIEAMVTWLSDQFAMPRVHTHPEVVLASAAAITTFRFTGRLSDRPQDAASVPPGQHEIVAAYDAISETIYLPRGWTGRSAAELSVLVHELVHHLQHVAALRYECAQAAEELAYAAQEKWLRLFGRSLESEFQIDPFTRLVNTRCMT
jgi:hypothetical protein